MPKPKKTQSHSPNIVALLKHLEVKKLVNHREDATFIRLEPFEDSPLEGDPICDGLYALRTDGKWIDFSKFRSSPDVRNAAVELVTPEEGLALLSAIAKDLPSFKSKLESALKEVLPE